MKLSKKSRRVITITAITIFIGILILLITRQFSNNKNNDNGNNNYNNYVEQNNNEIQSTKIQGIRTLGNIEFSNVTINLLERNKSEFIADVKNISDEFLNSTNVRIKIINRNGTVKEVFGGIVENLAGHEERKFKVIVLSNILDAMDIQLEMIDEEVTKDE